MFKWLFLAAADEGGYFPQELSEMYKLNVFEKAQGDAVLPGVIEYRGAGRENSDDADLLLFRYRAVEDHEARVTVGGKVTVVPSSTPLPPQ